MTMRRQSSWIDEWIDSASLNVGAVNAEESVHAAHKSRSEYPEGECWQHVDSCLWTASSIYWVERKAIDLSLKRAAK
jgi:hypothetical protein